MHQILYRSAVKNIIAGLETMGSKKRDLTQVQKVTKTPQIR